jgi:hypothetical protein
MRRAGAIVTAAVLIVLLWPAAATAAPRATHARLLPDLVTMPLTDLRIQKAPGVKRLRFSNTIANTGVGPLELYPVANDCNGNGDFTDDRTAMEQPYVDSNDDGVFERRSDQPSGAPIAVGCYVFHPAHDHWHLQDFARYELHRWSSNGAVVASALKVSFCVGDDYVAQPNLPGSPRKPYYVECGSESTTGLSIGWADWYPSNLQGQALDIRGVANGRYCLVSAADPDGHILESDATNNVTTLRIRINGTDLIDTGLGC